MPEASLQWSVIRAALDPVLGSEQAGTRPVLVVSAEAVNATLPIVTVLPITTRKPGRRVYATEVLLVPGTAGLPNESLVMAHQVRTIARQRLSAPYGSLDGEDIREQIRTALRLHLDLF